MPEVDKDISRGTLWLFWRNRAASVARSRTRYRAARKEDVLRHPARKPALFGAPGLARGAHLAQHHLEASMTTGFSTGTAVPGLSQQGATGVGGQGQGVPGRVRSPSADCSCQTGLGFVWVHLFGDCQKWQESYKKGQCPEVRQMWVVSNS